MENNLEKRIENIEKEIELFKSKFSQNPMDHLRNPSSNLVSQVDLQNLFTNADKQDQIIKDALDIEFPSGPHNYISTLPNINPDILEYPEILGSWEEEKNLLDIIKNYDDYPAPDLQSFTQVKSAEEEKIEKVHGKTIFKFPVLHLGWEADGWGYVIDRDSKREVILSNHGKFYTASIKELEQKLAEYKKVEFETKKAIELLNNYEKLD